MAPGHRGLSAAALAAAVLALAACGGGGGPGGARTTATSAASPSRSGTPDRLDALRERARSCGLAPPAAVQAPRDLVPLLPEPAVVTGLEPAGAGYRAVAFIGRPLVEALAAIAAAGQRQGYTELAREREPFDAEISLRNAADGSVWAFRLTALNDCADAIQATIVRLQT